jgi:hypothetical protein
MPSEISINSEAKIQNSEKETLILIARPHLKQLHRLEIRDF